MKVVIVHGCPSNKERAVRPEKRTYDKHWIPWIKKKLSEKKIETFVPLMPEPWAPNYKNWKKEFDKLNINKNSILIGHSCGCAFLVRWLGEVKIKIKKLILVAPWKVANKERHKERFIIKKRFYNYPIDDCVKKNVKEIIIFTSNNEEED